jgi:hypothetical protein
MSPNSPDRRRRRRLRQLYVAVPAGVVALVVGVVGVLAYLALSGARGEVTTARLALEAARVTLSANNLAGTTASLDRAAHSIDQASARGGKFPLNLLEPIPLVGSPVKALAAGGRAGQNAVAAGRILNGAVGSFLTPGTAGVDGHNLSAVHAAANASDGAVVTATARLTAAHDDLAGPAGAFLPQISSEARSLRRTVDGALRQLNSGNHGLDLVAKLTAPDTDARILLLSQDTMELRATGGFIGSFGVFHFDHGTVKLERFDSFEALPVPDPPMQAPDELATVQSRPWDLSNSNWWPDFPTSAKTAVEMFRRQGGGEVNGVMAITETVMADLVGVFGPIDVPGYDQPVTKDGFAQRIVYEVELKRPLDSPRKKFLTLLSDTIFARLFALPPAQLPAVVKALGGAAGAGDLQVWFSDPAWEQNVAGTPVDGALPTDPKGDFLLFAESNMTASKANADLVRAIHYGVKSTGGHLVATLDIDYRDNGVESEVNPYYNGLIRVYVPKGSELAEDSMGFTQDATDGPYTEISAQVFVAAKGEQRVTFTYTLPPGVDAGGYHLTWIRQPGTPADTLTATIGSHTFDAGAVSGRRFVVSASP